MQCIRAAFVDMRCLSVCLSVMFVHSVKTNKDIFEIFSLSSSDTILVFIARQHTDARYCYSKSVCLSVRPSVRTVPILDENGLTYCHSFFSPYGIHFILVLSASNNFTKFRRGHCRGNKYRWGIKISSFSTNKSLYLADDTR